MIGGSMDAFIGSVHRKAAALDGHIDLVCGAFSSNPAKSSETGESLYLPENRVYGSYQDMIEKESQLPENERMEFVAIVTPNHLHFAPAKMALEAGFHVMLDKPLAFNLNEAKELERIVSTTGLLLGVTYTYTGYPMVKHARHIVRNGDFGEIRKVYVEYPQGWLSNKLEDSGQKQASWRTDPKRSGMSGAFGDIGTHAENMVEFVTRLEIVEISANLNKVVEGRLIDDDGVALLKFNNGATGVLTATQIASGEENDLKVRVYGENGSLEWCHNDPNTLVLKWLDKPKEILRAGADKNLCEAALKNSRLPSGHPEGYLEAFANLYKNFAHQIDAFSGGITLDEDLTDVPTVADGVRGMNFIEKSVESSEKNGAWILFNDEA